MSTPAFPTLDLAPAAVDVERRADGTLILTSPEALGTYAPSAGHWLIDGAAACPDRVLLAERSGEDWRTISWQQALHAARAIGQALLNRGLGPAQPIMVLSGNSVDHGLLMLGAYLVGVPIAPVSPAYSLRSEDCGKVRHVYDQVRPGLVFVDDPKAFQRALATVDSGAFELVSSTPAQHATPLTHLLETSPTSAVDTALAAIQPESIAKILFTSGSTGMPKGVLNPHRMICSNQQMIAQAWRFLDHTPPVLVDWLPWNHTFGGNHNFHMVLRNRGSLYIDEGKPVPGLVEHTAKNLTSISPTIFFNVPAGFQALLPFLETDEALRTSFFSRLQAIFYAGAALSQDLWRRMETVCLDTLQTKVFMTSAWGATETAPLATTVHFPIEEAGVIGLPAAGVELKLAPVGNQLEMRVRGPNVTPGYLGDPVLTETAFDSEGFYCTGDAGVLADPEEPSRGVRFNGRTAEDFKLTTGTWVHSGNLRLAVLEATASLLQNVVIAGHDRDDITILAWPAPGAPADVRAQIRDRLIKHNTVNSGSSTRIARVCLMDRPPSIDANEITDKGYVNQRAVLTHRHHLVERLYAEPVDNDIIVVD